MRVFLSNPPWRKGNYYGIRAGSRWPFMVKLKKGEKIPGYLPMPFFLAYAASLLEKNNIDVLLVDSIAEAHTDDDFLKKVKEYKPDLFLIETSTPSINTDLNWIKKIKNIFPNVKTILTGPHATVFAENLLKENEYLDFVLSGEYEYILLNLIRSIEKGKNGEDVRGVTFRKGSNVIKNPPADLVKNLDEIPWPARHFLPMFAYNDAFAGLPSPNVQIWASRGCPYKCIFCNWPKTMYGGSSYRVRDVKDVVKEIKWLIDKYGFKAFYFDDDTFNIGKNRIIALCEELKNQNINIPWAIMARADTSDEETFKIMKDAGLYAVKFGVESGVQEIIDNCGKSLDLQRVIKSVEIMKKLCIKVHLTFTFGLPGETKETIKQTLDFLKKVRPDSAQFSIVTPFPGTAYYDMLDSKGYILSKNWDDYDGNNLAVIRTEKLTSDELVYYYKWIIKEWDRFVFITNYLMHPIRTLKKIIEKPERIKKIFKIF
ncbi:MAG: B12-binding domain-containing radical SAM protein [Candidatus Goldbacteria bacterium]|nr:B12-binding domain-containing radical SAM protein [Candidatus Goldiibacteriota bacterium]